MKKKAVIFDMDGVIFDSEILVQELWAEVAARHGVKDVVAVCRECLGLNREATKEVFQKQYGADFPYDAYKSEVSALFHERAGGGKLRQKPGIRELLLFLRERRIRTAVASSTRTKIVRSELEAGGLLALFDNVVGGDQVKRSKPEPDIFLMAVGLLQIHPQEAYVIEDSYNGIRAASGAGCSPIMVPDLAAPTEEMYALAEAVLPSLCAVQEYLSSPGRL